MDEAIKTIARLIGLLLLWFALGARVALPQDCSYWQAKVDPKVPDVDRIVDEAQSDQILEGIGCLLRERGNVRTGIPFDKPEQSQILPKPSVEVAALYYASILYYGNDNFASGPALVSKPAEFDGPLRTLRFNSPSYIEKAYESYTKWYCDVKRLGLAKARQEKLNPLANSGVEWY
ncbi:MAG: hypothetical protein JO314_02785 [Acidobacteria bacterium]|nr:hypothetical protein [Acidobacteriota bacterium]